MVLLPSESSSSSGVDRMIPLCESRWYSDCTSSVLPLTTTLAIRRSCHDPPIRSGEPPAAVERDASAVIRLAVKSRLAGPSRCELLQLTLVSETHIVNVLVVERHPLLATAPLHVVECDCAVITVDACQDDTVAGKFLPWPSAVLSASVMLIYST